MRRVKICGVKDEAAFDAVVEARADWIGFNFFPSSPRYLTPALSASLSARHAGGPKRVALFVKPTDDAVAEVMDTLQPDIVQLYAPIERVAEIRATFGVPVWRAVGVGGIADLPDQSDGADALLIEAKAPADATRPGGNAARFDWGILTDWSPGFGWLLAGGLSPDNVRVAIQVTNAPAYDVSSGVESAPGVKDPALIRAFVRAVRAG